MNRILHHSLKGQASASRSSRARIISLSVLLLGLLVASRQLLAQSDTAIETTPAETAIEEDGPQPRSIMTNAKSAIPASPMEIVDAMGIGFTLVFVIAQSLLCGPLSNAWQCCDGAGSFHARSLNDS
ncbi:MAG: hypothetical protein R3C20_02180 [Planctomycetaceae bacterium]